MQLRFQGFDDFVVFFKPNGLRMHLVDDGQFGFVEAISAKMQQPLFIVHRLDKETSGLVLFAKSKAAASMLTELFEDHLVQKTYFFLTDQTITQKKLTVRTHIEKLQNHFVNSKSQVEPNSETEFEYQKASGQFHLWKATPKTGKPHQIRLHAQHAGISVCGDSEHGGCKWFRLALHASGLRFSLKGTQHNFSVALPPSFENADVFPIMNLFQDAIFNKTEFLQFDKNSCFRLIHTEGAAVRADVFGRHLWVYDYAATGLSTLEIQKIQDFANENELSSSVRHMVDRGTGVGGLEKSTLHSLHMPTSWNATEATVTYELRTDSGFSPGLFLDQKENRAFVRNIAAGKSVLNLFSYTGGFSVVAAIGNAKQVTTVDVSKKFLEWSKENFKLNQILIEKNEFFAQDCLLFLKGAKKRERTWDLIICDPPSFGRSQDAVWKIEKNLPELAELMWACLAESGQILFTCNYEKWTRNQLLQEFVKKLPKTQFKIARLPFLSLDFGETDDTKNVMKGFLLQRLLT